MSCQDYEIALGDYVDGTLDERARVDVEAHLASCERCRAVVADLERDPSDGAGARAANCPARRCGRSCRPRSRQSAASTFRGWGFTWQHAGASLVAITLIASLAWIGNGLAPINAPSGRLASARAGSSRSRSSVEAEFDLAEAQYTTAIAGLESITKSEQSALDMDTADVLQANLTVIDGAITREPRGAADRAGQSGRAGEPVRCAAQQARAAAGRRRTHQRDAERQS